MKKFLSLLTALLFVGSMWGETYTLGWGTASGTTGTFSNFTAVSGTVDGIVSFSSAKNSSSTAPAYNSSNSELRLYYNSGGDGGSVTLTPASGVTITGFVMTTSTAPSVEYSVDGGAATSVSASNNTYTVSGISSTSSIRIQNVNTTNTQLRITTIQITYTTSGGGNPKCATPTFSPEGGTFTSAQNVSISCETEGATIYYTINGNNPTTESSVYSSPIPVSATTTIKALAVKDGLDNSSIASAKYTINKNAITLTAGQTLSFDDFTGAGSSYGDANKQFYLEADDNENYKCTGTNVLGNASYLQMQDKSATYITFSPVTSANGYKMTVTTTQNSVTVYVGNTEKTAVSGVYYFSSGDAVTLKRSGGTTKVSNITFTGLKLSRSVTFPDGNQNITVGGETITKAATISPAGTATYSSSDETIATVDENTGEVTAVKAGTVTITATVAEDEGYEQSKGSYTVTVNRGATTLAFTHAEETVELVDGSATYTATLTPADGRSVTYSSDDITVNSSTGAVTYTAIGDYVIKANANASDKYLAPAEASYTLHVIDSREPVVSNVNLVLKDDGDNVIALDEVVKENTGTLSATYTKAAGFSGDEVVSFASSDDDVFYVSGTDFAALKGGEVTVTVTITSGGNNLYTDVVKAFTVTITNPSKSDNELAVMDDETNVYEDGDALNLTYGTSFDLDVSASTGYDGTIGAVFANNEIAEVNVSGSTYTINPLAVGSTTLTLSAPETANFKAAEDITLTINVASIDAKTTSEPVEGVVEDLDFSKYYVPDTWEMTTTNVNDYQAWTNNDDNDFISANGYYNKNRYAGTYDYITDEYDLARYTSANLIFEHAGQYFSTISDGVKLFAKVNGVEQELTINTYFAGTSYNTYAKNTTDITSLCGQKIKIIFRYISDGTNTNTGRWDIKNFKISGTTNPSEEVTLNEDGYATFCSQYPLDFSDYETAEYSAWQITNVVGSKITFSQIKGKIMGGQGILLKGNANDEITLRNALSSDDELTSNMLVGCMAPTYLQRSELNYELVYNGEKSEFQILSGKDVTVPANKAYLHVLAPLAGVPETLQLDFSGGETPTSISNTEAEHTIPTTKVLRDNQIYILRGDKTYTIDGQLVK